jgi:hypothetical protein
LVDCKRAWRICCWPVLIGGGAELELGVRITLLKNSCIIEGADDEDDDDDDDDADAL